MFLVLGDTGLHNPQQLGLAAHINEETPNFLLHMGDLAYPDGTDREYTLNHFDVYAPVLQRAPLFPAPGDHDLRTNWGEPYIEAFLPRGQAGLDRDPAAADGPARAAAGACRRHAGRRRAAR